MHKLKIANAPCSWGALEFDLEAPAPDYLQVLREIRESGYEGTELGDWGFMPTTPEALRDEVSRHDLDMIGAFVPVALADPAAHEPGVAKALQVARLLAEAGYAEAFVVLADDNGRIPERTRRAGRVTSGMALDDHQWKVFAHGTEAIAKAVWEAYRIRTVFHHHCAGYVETPEELERLMELTDPELVGLCFDTGHYAFGGGDPVDGLRKYHHRIRHVHFKDYEPRVGARSRLEGWDYFESVRRGVFCELGRGSVNFATVLSELNDLDYRGWIVVEQDVLPGMGSPLQCAHNNRIYLEQLGL